MTDLHCHFSVKPQMGQTYHVHENCVAVQFKFQADIKIIFLILNMNDELSKM